MASARRLYRFNVALALLGTTAVVVAVVSALRSVHLGAPGLDRFVGTCWRFLAPDFSAASLLVLALAALGAAVAIRGARSLGRHLLRERAFFRRLGQGQPRSIGCDGVVVIESAEPHAFCAGYLRPKIFISRGALERLTGTELEAVIAHERHHQRRRDPLRIMLVEALADALFFMPALRCLTDRYTELAELAADEAAVDAGAGESALASALLVFGEQTEPSVAVGIAPERVEHLLGKRPRWELPVSVLAGSLVLAATVGAAALSAASGMAGAGPSLSALAAELCMAVMAGVAVLLAVATAVYSWRRLARPLV